MVPDIVCNYKKCRKPLQIQAWVTICSHAFCMEHGEQEFGNQSRDIVRCPACNMQLGDKFDVVQADLDPSEGFKSIVLAGMKPDIIMDIAMRSIAFWTYQIEEETRYNENLCRYIREKMNNTEEHNTAALQNLKTELTSTKTKIDNLQIEYDKQKRQTEEYSVRLDEKERKIQRLQHELQTLKRNSCHVNDLDDFEPKRKQNLTNIVMSRHQTSSDFHMQSNVAAKNQDDTQLYGSYVPDDDDSFTFAHNPIIRKLN